MEEKPVGVGRSKGRFNSIVLLFQVVLLACVSFISLYF